MSKGLRIIMVGAYLVIGVYAGAGEVSVIRVGDEVLHPVSPLFFGQFLERASWSGEQGVEAAVDAGTGRIRADVAQMLEPLHIPVVRFPGGTSVDYLDWRDLVTDGHGPGTGRPMSTYLETTFSNRYGYDDFFQDAERLGWKTLLTINLRDGLMHADARPAIR